MITLRNSINYRRKRIAKKLIEIGEKDSKKCFQGSIMYQRWLCRNDLFFLTALTGHEKIAMWMDFYRPFCDEVSLMNWKIVESKVQDPSEDMLKLGEVSDDGKDLVYQRMYLCYRGFYKTTIITICHSCQLLLNFPNIHIVLCHNKQRTSSDNLIAIKNLFLNRPKYPKKIKEIFHKEYGIDPIPLRTLFPEYVPDGKEWGSAEKFSVFCRTDRQRPEDSVEAVGVDTEITGGHWQVAKKNDLVTEKSVNTEEQILKTMDWDARFNKGHFDDFRFPLQDYEGTRYHHADMYSTKKNDRRIKLKEIKLVSSLEDFNNGDDSVITHRVRYKRKDIKSIMDDMWVFMCQMQQTPEDPSKMQFSAQAIRYFDSVPSGCNYHLMIDPASTRKKGSDYTAMLVIGVIKMGDKICKYIVDGVRDKLNPDQRINEAVALCKKWDVKMIGWEAVGFANIDCYNFEERRRKEGLSVKVEEIKYNRSAKEDRIRSLVPEYANNEWFWPEKGKVVKNSIFDSKIYDLTDKMEYELVQFPLCEHDDLMDCMAFLDRLEVVTPLYTEEEDHDEGMTYAEYHKLCDDNRHRRNDVWNRQPLSYV